MKLLSKLLVIVPPLGFLLGLFGILSVAGVYHVAIENQAETIAISVPDSEPETIWTIEYSTDLTNWTWCYSQTTGSAPVLFFKDGPTNLVFSPMFFRARKS